MNGIVNELRQRGLTVTFAESCTGGLLAKLITDVPGASAVFRGSVVSYSAEIKEKLLGVSPETVRIYGEVSRETALEMARGARRAIGADIAVSVTGSAGPEPDEPGKPVGLIWLAADCDAGSRAVSLQNDFPADARRLNREAAADAAKKLISDILSQGNISSSENVE